MSRLIYKFGEGDGLFGNKTVDTITSYIPGLDLAQDLYTLYKNPSWRNAGNALITAGLDFSGLQLLKTAGKAAKAYRASLSLRRGAEYAYKNSIKNMPKNPSKEYIDNVNSLYNKLFNAERAESNAFKNVLKEDVKSSVLGAGITGHNSYKPGGKLKEVSSSTYVAPKGKRLLKRKKLNKPNRPLMLNIPDTPELLKYIDFVNEHEGQSITNTRDDRGGLTNNGLTLGTWLTLGWDKNNDNIIDGEDLKLITPEDHKYVLTTGFWNLTGNITDPKLKMYVTDYIWGSGYNAFNLMHKAFGLKPKPEMTPELLHRINTDPNALDILHNSRTNYYKYIVSRDPTLAKFLDGWLRRANDLYNNDI